MKIILKHYYKPIFIQTSSSIGSALEIIEKHGVQHIHALENKAYKGTLSKETLEGYEPETNVKSILHESVDLACKDGENTYQLWKKFIVDKLSSIPLVEEKEFIGALSIHDFILFYENEYNLTNHGSWIACSMNKINYSLSLVSSITEEHHASVQNLLLIEDEQDEELIIVFRINTHDTDPIINSMSRHNLEVLLVHNNRENQEPLRDRYEELMHYLNV